MHATSIQAVDDMVQLVDIHESAILRNLKEKYSRDQVYVSFVNFNG
jgi:myosin heavy subunit